MNKYLVLHFADHGKHIQVSVAYHVTQKFCYISWARCSPEDKYCEKTGFKIADERLERVLDDYRCVSFMFSDMAAFQDGEVFRLNLVEYFVDGPRGYEKLDRAVARSVALDQREYINKKIRRMNKDGYWYKE